MDFSNLKAYLRSWKSVTPETISVVISHYNQPKSIKLVLEGLERQTLVPDEVLIADDGSRESHKERLQGHVQSCSLDVQVHTQPDHGFRKEKILNKVVRNKSRGQLLIFLDGDTIPNQRLVENYGNAYEPFSYTIGWLKRLTLEDSKELYDEGVSSVNLRDFLTGTDRVNLGVTTAKQHLYALLARWLGKPDRPTLYGANWAVDRGLFFGVNGFDEFYGNNKSGTDSKNGDSDIRNRMNVFGAKPKVRCSACLGYHLNHDLNREASDKAGELDGTRSMPENKFEDYERSKYTPWPREGLS